MKAGQAFQEARAKTPPSMFLTELFSTFKAERRAAQKAKTNRIYNRSRWIVFNDAVLVMEENMESPVNEVLAALQKEARAVVKTFGKHSGRGQAALDILTIIKKHAGGEG